MRVFLTSLIASLLVAIPGCASLEQREVTWNVNNVRWQYRVEPCLHILTLDEGKRVVRIEDSSGKTCKPEVLP